MASVVGGLSLNLPVSGDAVKVAVSGGRIIFGLTWNEDFLVIPQNNWLLIFMLDLEIGMFEFNMIFQNVLCWIKFRNDFQNWVLAEILIRVWSASI